VVYFTAKMEPGAWLSGGHASDKRAETHIVLVYGSYFIVGFSRFVPLHEGLLHATAHLSGSNIQVHTGTAL
jgi:hypothetical protein